MWYWCGCRVTAEFGITKLRILLLRSVQMKPSSKIFMSNLRKLNTDYMKQYWLEEHETSETEQSYKRSSGGILAKPWLWKTSFKGRDFISTITRLRFNHNQLRPYRDYIWKSPNCDCGEIEDVQFPLDARAEISKSQNSSKTLEKMSTFPVII
ncbi:hypothetical protein QE152_g19511 [Popillia japonica]|uniref:Uncharacterized protein n=1 Tax=Popillia japonica TaxID=7064 RepID=A0AAW1KRJ8_POPJA